MKAMACRLVRNIQSTWLSSVLVALARHWLALTVLTVGLQAQTPVGKWAFDDGLGTKAVDSSGNNHNATLVNGVSWVQGEIGGAISANSANQQYVSIPPIDLSGTQAVTVTLWVNRTYSIIGWHALFEASTDYNYSATGFGLFPDDATCVGVRAALHGNLGYAGNCYNQPSSGIWHHLAVVFDKSQSGGNQIQFYIDAVLQTVNRSLNATTNTNNFGNNPIYLFSRAGNKQFNSGLVDDLRIYNRALTATQIQQIYDSGKLVSVAVAPNNPSLAVGAQLQFSATGTYKDGSQQNLTRTAAWTSSAPSLSSISGTGLATALTVGSATIKATSASVSGSTTLTVTSQPQVSLSWTASKSSGVVGYNAYRSAVSGGPYSKLNSSVIAKTSFDDVTVQSGHTYFYVSTAINSRGIESVHSNEAVATVP